MNTPTPTPTRRLRGRINTLDGLRVILAKAATNPLIRAIIVERDGQTTTHNFR